MIMNTPKLFIKRSYRLSIAALLLTIFLAVSQYLTSREYSRRLDKLEKLLNDYGAGQIGELQKFTGTR
jgi:HAMP domain-containing protein